jgi:hypothetical protein
MLSVRASDIIYSSTSFCAEVAALTSLTRATRRPALRMGALATVAIIAALPVSGCGGSSKKPGSRSAAVAATVADLKNLQSSLRHPIYWAGAKARYTYELTQTSGGSVYVRYLPSGVKVGDPRPAFLTVGTYPQAGAYKNVVTASKRRGARKLRLANGGLAIQNASRPTSVYMAYPNSGLLIEVYDPSAKSARALVRSGRVRPLR